MKTAAFIPIKSHSERVPGKNFRNWKGRPLYQWIITRALDAGCFADVFVDTDSADVMDFARQHRVSIIHRRRDLAGNGANGNDLIAHHYDLFPEYDAYFQLFATAPELRPETIASCVDTLTLAEHDGEFDSVMTGAWIRGWFWLTDRHPLYRPSILPRSQDWISVWKESTGLYGILREPLKRYRQRIGARPIMYPIDDAEMVDIDTPADMALGATA